MDEKATDGNEHIGEIVVQGNRIAHFETLERVRMKCNDGLCIRCCSSVVNTKLKDMNN